MIKAFQKKLPQIIFLFLLIVYVHNLSRSVYGGDVGDFVSAAIVGGVPHPSGYPFITLLGFLLTRINFITPAFMVNLISAVSAAIGGFLFFKFTLKATNNRLIAVISTFTLAFNYLYWFFAEIAEVFALNNLFVIILIYLGYLFYSTRKTKYFYLLAFFAGLSMTNNYIISFTFPAIGILLLTNIKFFLKKPKTILKGILVSFLGFSPVLYILIAAQFNPVINWDNTKDIKGFIDVILRKHYGTFGVGFDVNLILAEKINIQKNYLLYLLNQITIPVAVISFFGILELFKNKKIFLLAIILSFILSGPVFINLIGIPYYSLFQAGIYERFFSMSAVVFLFLFPFGLKFIVNLLNSLFAKKTYQNLFLIVFLIIPVLLFKYNFPKTDLHDLWIGDKIGYDILSFLPKNSYILITGDTPLFNTWYVHFGLKYRTDLKLLNFVGTNTFNLEREKFLKNNPKLKIEDELFLHVLKDLSKKNNVFSLTTYQFKKGEKLNWVPYGLAYKLENGKNNLSKDEYIKTQKNIWNNMLAINDLKKDSLSKKSLTISEIPYFYSNNYLYFGNYVYEKYKDRDFAIKTIHEALQIDKNNHNAYILLSTYLIEDSKCAEATEQLSKVKELNPFETKYYLLSYYNNRFCYKDKKKIDQIIKEYSQVFKGDFFKDLKIIK